MAPSTLLPARGRAAAVAGRPGRRAIGGRTPEGGERRGDFGHGPLDSTAGPGAGSGSGGMSREETNRGRHPGSGDSYHGRPALQRDVAVLLRRERLAFGPQRAERAGHLGAGLGRPDDSVNIAAL